MKKLLSLALALVLCLGLIPAMASAAGETQIDCGYGLSVKLSAPVSGTREMTVPTLSDNGEMTITAYVVPSSAIFKFEGYDDPSSEPIRWAWVPEDGNKGSMQWFYCGPTFIDDIEWYLDAEPEEGLAAYNDRRYSRFEPGLWMFEVSPYNWPAGPDRPAPIHTYFFVEDVGGKAIPFTEYDPLTMEEFQALLRGVDIPEDDPALGKYLAYGNTEGAVTSQGLSVCFYEGNYNEIGITYGVAITNTSSETVSGCYALLTYLNPNSAQFMCFDLDLAPGETYRALKSSGLHYLSRANAIWVSFDSIQERASFLDSPAILAINSDSERSWTNGFRADEYNAPNYFVLNFSQGPAFLREHFGIQ